MEYDRALYRVYERIMEDLNASPSPLALTSPSSAGQNSISQHSGGLRRRHNRSNQDNVDLDSSVVTSPLAARDSLGPNNSDVSDDIIETNNNTNTESGDEPNNDNSSRQQRRRGRRQRRRDAIAQLPIIARRQFTTATQQQRRHQPLPFIMPIWMARKVDNLHYQFDTNRRMANMDNNVGIATHIWSNIRGILGVIRYTSTTASYDSVPTSSVPTPYTPTRISTTFQSNYTQSLSSTPGAIIRTASHRDDDDSPPDVEEGNGGLELQTLNIERSDSGLRRRSPTRRPSPSGDSSFSDSRRTSGGPPSLPTNHTSNSPLQPRVSSPSGSSSSDVNNPNISLTQRAIQNQQRQNDRLTSHRRRGRGRVVESDDDDDSDNSDSDSDDDNSTSSSSSDESDEDTNNNTGNEGCSQYNLYGVMRLSFGVAILHIFVLISLHATYVGPYAFHKQAREVNIARRKLLWGHVETREGDKVDGDQDREIRTLYNCISYALSTRPLEERSTYFGEKKDDSSSDGDNDEKKKDEKMKSESDSTDTTTKSASPTPLLGVDEILQIKIMYGGKCTGRCSRVRNVQYPVVEIDTADNSTDKEVVAVQTVVNDTAGDHHIRGLKQTKSKNEEGNSTVDEFSSPAYWEKVHYQFAIDDALLYLDETAALLHNITLVNITVTERCLSTGSDDGRLTFLTATGQFLSQIYGMDSVIINQLMYGIRGIDDSFTTGYMKNIETSERWSWRKEFLESFEHRSIFDWILRKIGVLLLSTLAFFLITSVTSLIVRVLTSSGVVLMFPLFTLFRRMGMPANERILAMSYPWIGSVMAAVANERVHPPSHLVWAHVTKIILYYVMYEACQAAWSVVIYHKSIPEALPVWIYGFTMIWEYFSMVFIRSALSVYFFPRLCFLYFLLYHCYFYSVPYGYFDVALIPLFMFMVHAMLYIILGLELPNAGKSAFVLLSSRGVINVECPREVYNRLSWQAPLASLPPEYTIFLPLNSRLSPLHDRVNNNNLPSNNNNGNRGDEASGDDNDDSS